jgi:hypothetical protein
VRIKERKIIVQEELDLEQPAFFLPGVVDAGTSFLKLIFWDTT